MKLIVGLGMLVAVVFLSLHLISSSAIADDVCSQTSQAALTACNSAADEASWLAKGKCFNISNPADKQACIDKAEADLNSALDLCNQQYDARQAVCGELGGGAYDPVITAADFAGKSYLTGNTYCPLKSAVYTYESRDSSGKRIERDVVKVTQGTREILGVDCRIVRDTVTDLESNEVTEDTTDWYAQDKNGNVWYFGEIAQQFEGGILVGIEGSWTAGVDEAKPGIIMYANPSYGVTYRQEFLLGEAEDVSKVVEKVDNLPGNPKLPKGVHGPYLHTQDFSALEPGVVEDKYYAPGVGLVLVLTQDGTMEVLVSIKDRSSL